MADDDMYFNYQGKIINYITKMILELADRKGSQSDHESWYQAAKLLEDCIIPCENYVIIPKDLYGFGLYILKIDKELKEPYENSYVSNEEYRVTINRIKEWLESCEFDEGGFYVNNIRFKKPTISEQFKPTEPKETRKITDFKPVLSEESVFSVLTKKWLTLGEVCSKLGITEPSDITFVKIKLTTLKRKEIIEDKIIENETFWKLSNN